MLPFAIIHIIWKERNSRIFEEKELTRERIYTEIKATLFYWCTIHPEAAEKMTTEFMILLLAGVFFSTLVHCAFPSKTLILETMGSTDMDFTEIRARDQIRHVRMFESAYTTGVLNFPLGGSSDPYVLGRYFTRVKLGNPPREYYLAIDTGSDITWINCISCNGCPQSSTLIDLSFYDPHVSYSSEALSCSGRICKSVAEAARCSSNSLCSYSIPYGDGSSVAGYYMSDMLHVDTIIGNSAKANFTTIIVFGCTNNVLGSVTNPQLALDGILGLGHQPISVVSQMASRELTPQVFSHCLEGKGNGGGVLVFGEIVEPGIVYSPLVPSQPHYSLNLQSISVNGQTVPISPDVFATSRTRGTIVDSGSTYAYLPEEVYNPFVTTLTAAVPSVSSFESQGGHCFVISSSTRDIFPLVSFNFAGGASMVLKPEEYLIQHFDAAPGTWCLGFLKNQLQISQGMTVLGDLVLKDKVIVYDLARQRLGWVDYNCSSMLNVSLSKHASSSSRDVVLDPIAITGLIVFISLSAAFLFYV